MDFLGLGLDFLFGLFVSCWVSIICGQNLSVDAGVENDNEFVHFVFRDWKNRGIRVEYIHGRNSHRNSECLQKYYSGRLHLHVPPIPGVLPVAQAVIGPPLNPEDLPVVQVNLPHTPRVVPADLPVAQAVATSSDVVVNVTA